MTGADILRLLIRDRAAALQLPHVGAALILPDCVFADPVHRRIARALWLNEDWRAAVKWLRSSRAVEERRLCDFESWAAKVAARPVRGLLEAPGTADRGAA